MAQSYVAVSRLVCGDVEAMWRFCHVITGVLHKPYHVDFLERKLIPLMQICPVYLQADQVRSLVHKSYVQAMNRHKNVNPLSHIFPNRIQYYFSGKRLVYRPHRAGVIVTLDMDSSVSLLSVQGYSLGMVRTYTSRAGINLVVPIETDRVLLPSEMLEVRVPLGMVL